MNEDDYIPNGQEFVQNKFFLTVLATCPTCHGNGKDPCSYYSDDCMECDGRGHFRAIRKSDVMDMIRENLHQLLADAKIKVVRPETDSAADAIDNPAEKTNVEFARVLAEE